MKKQLIFRILTVGLLLLLVFSFTLTADTKYLPAHVQDELDNFITGVMETNHVPGLAACIVKGKRVIWTGTYGMANIEKNLPVTKDTLFQLASVSKPFVATAIMQLYEKKLFGLDDDINNYLPFSVRNPNYPDSPITFRMLLVHTSGMRDNWGIMPYYWGQDSPIPLNQYLYSYLVPGGTIYDPVKNWWAVEPGAEWIYNNNTYVLLAYLVETISGQTFADYCAQNLYAPIGMDTATWFLAGLDLDTLAVPYYGFDGKNYLTIGYYGYSDYPAGLMKANIEEMSRFLAAYMWRGKYGTGRILKPQTVDLILSKHVDIYGGMGLGWLKYQGRWGGSGGDIGVSTTMYFNPETEVGVVVLTNTGVSYATNMVKDKLFEVGESN